MKENDEVMASNNYGFTEEDYNNYANRTRRVKNGMLREKGQSFAQAMCEGSIVEGIDKEEGIKILEAIKKAGEMNVG